MAYIYKTLLQLARPANTASADAEHLAVVADRVAAIKNPVLQKEIAGGCHLLAGLGFSQELINAYFTMGILDDSVTYQAAVAEYTRRGRLEGERHEAQALVLRLLPRRCGQLSHEQELAVRALPLEKLEALAEGGFRGKYQGFAPRSLALALTAAAELSPSDGAWRCGLSSQKI
ncbi:DUF4351 domain-containing protein [Synechococcus lacustris Tous-12m]